MLTSAVMQGHGERLSLFHILAAGSSVVLAAGVLAAYSKPQLEGILSCGDFPGFYVLPEILRRGQAGRLYDMQLQAQIENELWPECVHGGFLGSLYPPFFALLLFPLSWIGPAGAAVLFRLLNLLALAAAVRAASPLLSGRQGWQRWFFLSLLVLPLVMSIIGAQVTGLVVLLLTLAARALHERKDVLAGIAAALLLMKPQYGVFALLFLACVGSRRALAAAAGTIMIEYLAPAFLLGVQWPATWLRELEAFGGRNYVFNPAHQVSLYGAVRGFFVVRPVPQNVETVCLVAAAALSLLALCLALRAALRSSPDARANLFLLAGPSITLLSPQTLYYDLPLGLLALWPTVRLDVPRSRQNMLSLLVLIGVLTANFSFQRYPIFLPVTILLFVLSLKQAAAGAPKREPRGALSYGGEEAVRSSY